MKLWVDDQRPAPDGWVLARTVTDAVRLLANAQGVEEISLDHDIACTSRRGDLVWEAHASEETFEPVAYYIHMMSEVGWSGHVTIHTANPVAAIKLSQILHTTRHMIRPATEVK